MRTITEFFGLSLKSAAEKIPALAEETKKSAEEAMKAEGKPEEEIAAGLETAAKAALDVKIGETFKLEGEKLSMFTHALELMKDARGNVKRVVVMAKSNETENAPSSAKEIDGKFYLVENFPDAPRPAPREERGGRGGRDRKGGRGRDGKRGGGGRGPREAREGGGDRPRAPRAPAEPYVGPNRIVIGKKDGSAPTETGSAESTSN